MDTTPLSVSAAIETFNETFSLAHPAILIEGEVSSFKVNQGKFIFFDLKDETGSLNCFMMLFALKFPIEDGMKLQVLAEPRLTKFGKFSLTIRGLQPLGEGSLKKSLQLLKSKLENEGLFDESRKRPLPLYPQRIGIVSSTGAAGYKDFIKILNNRWGGLELVVADVTVQGLEAPIQVAGAIEHLNQIAQPLDAIAVVRGGGSVDDLAAFSSELVVRAVAASRAPVIIGVGHEVDEVLADFAADVRAATPSNAAELLVPDKTQVISNAEQQVSMIEKTLGTHLTQYAEDISRVKDDIFEAVNTFFINKIDSVAALRRTLVQLNPHAVLMRGYSIVKNKQAVVRSIHDVTIGDSIIAQVGDGTIKAEVENVSS